VTLPEDGVSIQPVLRPLLGGLADEREAREEGGALGSGRVGGGVRGGRIDREREDAEDELGGEARGVRGAAGGGALTRQGTDAAAVNDRVGLAMRAGSCDG